MDLRKLKTLIELVETSGIAELEIQEGEERVRITRSQAGASAPAAPAPIVAMAAPAAGPAAAAPAASVPKLKLVKGSHIVVPRISGAEDAYLLQNGDNRVVFALPFEGNFTLIGTTDVAWAGDPAAASAGADEEDYLLDLAGRFFAKPLARDEIVWRYAGVRPLLDDGSLLDVQATRTEGLDARGQAVAERARQVQGPAYGYQEEVVVHDVEPDADGRVTARMLNPAFSGGRGLSLTLRYQKEQLPYLWQWRNFKERAYVMGIEPGNADMRGRAYNRERGTLPMLATGERREYHLEVEAALGPN